MSVEEGKWVAVQEELGVGGSDDVLVIGSLVVSARELVTASDWVMGRVYVAVCSLQSIPR